MATHLLAPREALDYHGSIPNGKRYGMMKIRLGFGIGAWPFAERNYRALYDFVDDCESWGVDSLWFSDRIVGKGATLEPIVTIAVLSGRKGMMKFGTNALIMPLRNPVIVAKELATLDFLSNGRLLLVAGLGGEDPREYEACGVSKAERAPRTDEALQALNILWTQDEATFHGKYYNFENISLEPKPVQKPGPPVWIGGRSDAALRRTGRLGEGWLPSAITPQECRDGIEAIQVYAAESDRTIEDDHYGVSIICAIADTKEAALELAAPALARRREDVGLEAYTALGTPDMIQETLNEYVEAGITKFVLRPPGSSDVWSAQAERLAKEVIAPMQTPWTEKELIERPQG